MLRSVIIDDEPHCTEQLHQLLQRHATDRVHIMGNASSVPEAEEMITRIRPELVFLDVQIGLETGFDLLRKFSEPFFHVVFTTAYEKYAVQAFRFSAVDYLLKPIDPDDLLNALSKLEKQGRTAGTFPQISTLFHNMSAQNAQQKKLAIPVLNGLEFIEISHIIRCESSVNYTTLFLKNGKHLLVARTLKEFEEMLEEYGFFRIHNSHLVNLKYIKTYQKGKGGELILEDGSRLEVSTRRKEGFLNRIRGL